MNQSLNSRNTYIPALDGLRAMAVFLVILRHWRLPYINCEFGWIGVNLFFVLSGFLITSILLQEKTASLWAYLKAFYLKRSLRIFPIYYLYLFSCLIFFYWYQSNLNTFFSHTSLDTAGKEFKTDFLSLATYTYNFHNLISYLNGIDEVGTKFLGHLWSLAIEEQFYIVFPFMVYFLSGKFLKHILISVVVLSPFIRLAGGEYLKTTGSGELFQVGLIIYKTTFFQLDALALGCLLAVVGWQNIKISSKWLWSSVLLILVINFVSVFLLQKMGAKVSLRSLGFDLAANQLLYNTGFFLLDIKYSYVFSFLNIICIALLILCLRNNFMSVILSKKPFTAIGRISYGIYLYHNPLYVLFFVILSKLGLGEEGFSLLGEATLFIVFICLVFIIASISYRYIESPLLRLKDKVKTTHTISQ